MGGIWRPLHLIPSNEETKRPCTIRGRVADSESAAPLPGAVVRLVLADDETVSATADEAGYYELAVPPVPDFFALSASVAGYIPGNPSNIISSEDQLS